MKIVFVSNFYNHHQAFLSRKLYELTNGQYRFIAIGQIPSERKALGYSEDVDSFVMHYGTSKLISDEWINTADVVILGAAPSSLINERIAAGKIVFRYSEHLLKKGFQWWKYPIRWVRMHRRFPSKAPIYMLSASAYAAKDYAAFGLFRGKTYKWGYFPECKNYDNIDEVLKKKNPNEILWCGRFLDWKHPDDMLTVAKRLKEENIGFHISIIGTGEMRDTLNQMVLDNELTDFVSFLGSMSPEQVREHMERAGIYLFTSDRKEGWGAVLNEAMNSGCAVVASIEAGSTPYLVQNNVNGLTYSSCQVQKLYDHVKYLLQHPDEQARLGKVAYETIATEWNAQVVGERFYHLARHILGGEKYPDLYESGPCSKA